MGHDLNDAGKSGILVSPAHEQELLRLQTVCEESALEVDGIMMALDDKDEALAGKEQEVAALEATVHSLSRRLQRLEVRSFGRGVGSSGGERDRHRKIETETKGDREREGDIVSLGVS